MLSDLFQFRVFAESSTGLHFININLNYLLFLSFADWTLMFRCFF